MVEIAGWDVTWQLLFTGAVTGLGYAVLAAGIVLVYRATGVINFAQAEIGVLGAVAFAVLVGNYGVQYWAAFALCLGGGALTGAVIELTVVRRLFDASRVVLLVATIGVAQLLVALSLALPLPEAGSYPTAFGTSFEIGDDLRVGGRELSVVVLVVPVVCLLAAFLQRSRLGLEIRGTASDAETAQLVGVNPRRVSTIVWSIAGAFGAFTAIVLAPITAGTTQNLTTGAAPSLLLRALFIGLVARMRSLTATIVAGIGVGVAEALVLVNRSRNVGLFEVLLFAGVLVVVLARHRRTGSEAFDFAVGARQSPLPRRLASRWWARHVSWLAATAGLGAAALLPLVASKPSQLLLWSTALLLAAVAISVSMLTGWAGQLSLGQFAFVGLGGLTTIALHRGHDIGLGLPFAGEITTFSVRLPWVPAVLVATATGVLAAVLIGLPALRTRGLFLTVTTLAFAIAASQWLFRREALNGGRNRIPRQPRPVLGSVDFTAPRAYYYLCLAFLAVVALVVSRLRHTGAGRNMIAVRDNEEMTAAVTVAPTRAKLSSFAVAGGIASMAGALYVYLVPGFDASGFTGEFPAVRSLSVVAIAIIGGLGTVVGGPLGALWVVGLPAAFGHNEIVTLLTSSIGLLAIVMYFPGGFARVLHAGRDLLFRWAAARLPQGTEDTRPAAARAVPEHDRGVAVPAPGTTWLATHHVSVHFRGLVAVDDVSVHVERGEIVGLIGTNGAGKSTLMNAISGYVSCEGSVEVLGNDVSRLTPAQRHRRGLGRGFQDARLFPGLTVHETLLVALEARGHSLLLPSMFALPPSPSAERRKRAEADEIISFLGLGRYADRFVAELSTGTRRIVEFGCLLAVGARVLLLDEPTAGVAQRESEAFGPLVQRIRQELGAAILLIEHDMPLVMGISDRVYCLESGEVIAEGTPTEVRNDPKVVASYLGTDERVLRATPPAVLPP
jgi:ABC-type branched-subunit amino acid transport system ATPase component/ABC-type branched-subunit amino acid transport system permease subunit